MKKLLLAIALVAVTGGCAPDKSKACEGCSGSQLQYCEEAYEACDSAKHCSFSDIRREYAENRCIDGN